MTDINKEEAKALIYDSAGKVFSVDFTKKDGTLRHMNCRMGVTSHLKGGQLAYNPDEKGLIVCFDMQKEDYRMINVNTLQTLTINGKQYTIK